MFVASPNLTFKILKNILVHIHNAKRKFVFSFNDPTLHHASRRSFNQDFERDGIININLNASLIVQTFLVLHFETNFDIQQNAKKFLVLQKNTFLV